MQSECNCNICQGACKHKPGRFLPGEVAKAAKLLNLSEKDFFDKYIGVDWNIGGLFEKRIFHLVPITTKMKAGVECPEYSNGQCIFFINKKCSIHNAKPKECSLYNHSLSDKQCINNMNKIVKAWNTIKGRKEIQRLLGRKPKNE